jgi:hypothetical protein
LVVVVAVMVNQSMKITLAAPSKGSLRVEVIAEMAWNGDNPTLPFGISMMGGASNMTVTKRYIYY